jgi:di/tricarboxylate transporter
MGISVTPNPHAIAVMMLIALALFLFSRDRIPLETTSLGVMTALALGFVLFPLEVRGQTISPMEFFSGFSNSAMVAVVALMIAGTAVVRTGALEPAGRFLSRTWVQAPTLAQLAALLFTCVISAFMHVTPVVILMLPLLTGIALRTGKPASKTLMPMGFAALLGGMTTTIGTSTNLVVVSMAQNLGLPPMGIFHFTLPALIMMGLGVLYLWLVAPLLIPKRDSPCADCSPRIFTAQLYLDGGSKAVGKTLHEVYKMASYISIRQILRRPGLSILPLPDLRLQAGDVLVVHDTREKLKEYETVLGAALYSGKERVSDENPLQETDQQLAEVVITSDSPLKELNLQTAHFGARFDLEPLGIYRHGAPLSAKNLETLPLHVGDILLVQGRSEVIAELRRSGQLLLLDATTDLPRSRKASMALLLMVMIVLPAALGYLPIAVTAPLGVMAMILCGCLDWREAGRAVKIEVVLVIAAGLAMSKALVDTGAADFLAATFLSATRVLPPSVILAVILFFMAAMANAASHITAALIGTPIAVQIAHGLALSPEPFLLAVLFGSNLAFVTPVAYQDNILIMNAGGYVFTDFVRVGLPLTLLIGTGFALLLPLFFPF